jgi:dGTPase
MNSKKIYPKLMTEFIKWLKKYSSIHGKTIRGENHNNKILYKIENKNSYTQAVIDYIAGMSDNFSLMVFNELTTF